MHIGIQNVHLSYLEENKYCGTLYSSVTVRVDEETAANSEFSMTDYRYLNRGNHSEKMLELLGRMSNSSQYEKGRVTTRSY